MDNFNKGRTNRDAVRERSEEATLNRIEEMSQAMIDLGYDIEFGNIGKKTTYCLLVKGDEEIVGYTFIKNSKYLNVNIGKLKALQQAIARKELLEDRARQEEVTE